MPAAVSYTHLKRMEELVKIAAEDDAKTGGSGFYRIVQGFQRNYNEGIGLGYPVSYTHLFP